MIRSSAFARNVLSNWSAFFVGALVSFFLSPYVVRSLGAEGYGLWVLLGSLVGYLGLLDFGVRGAVTRYVAQQHAENRADDSSRDVSAGLLLFGSFGLLAILFGLVMAFVVPAVFDVSEALIGQARTVMVIGGVNMAVVLVGGVFGGVVTGLQRFDISSGVEIVVAVLRASAVVMALQSGQGLVALATIQLVCSVLISGSAWVASRRLYPELRLSFQGRLKPEMRKLLAFGAVSSLLNASVMVILYTDAIVVAAALPIGMVTFYSIASSLAEYSRQVVSGISVTMTPRASALQSFGAEAIERAILSAASIATLATGSVMTTFYLRGESFINLWMGPQYGEISGNLLCILGTVVLFGGARQIAVATMMGINKHRTLLPVFVAEALGNLALSIALVQYLGLVGVALGTLIPNLIVTLGIVPRLLQRAAGVGSARFVYAAWFAPLVSCIPFALGTALVERYFPARSLVVFCAQVALLLPLVALTAIGWGRVSGLPVIHLPAKPR